MDHFINKFVRIVKGTSPNIGERGQVVAREQRCLTVRWSDGTHSDIFAGAVAMDPDQETPVWPPATPAVQK